MTPLAAKTVDRASGALLLLLGIGAIWHAQSLSVPFAADPVGPKAFPTIAGAVLAVAGASIMLRPEAIEVEAGHRMRVAGVAIASLVYPFLLLPLGFVPATALLGIVTARAFGGKWVGSIIASILLAAAFLLIIDTGLGLPLPRGPLGI